MVCDASLPLATRAVAAWFCSGINYPYQHRVGTGDLLGLRDAYRHLGVPDPLVSATVLAAKRTRQPYAVLLPMVWLEVERSGPTGTRDRPIPASAIVAGVPLYALDEHTRLGKRAINTLAQENLSIRSSTWKSPQRPAEQPLCCHHAHRFQRCLSRIDNGTFSLWNLALGSTEPRRNNDANQHRCLGQVHMQHQPQ